MRRVVITGLGCITPLGNNIETMWNGLVNGVCAIDFIKGIPTDNLPVKFRCLARDCSSFLDEF